MMAEESANSFGPYAFTLAPSEAEAAAARLGLRQALNGGLLASHVAPLTAFVLTMAFASVLALTGLVSRRAGEIALMLAALAFMTQRLITHWRIQRARSDSRATIARLQSAQATTATFGDQSLSLEVDGRTTRLRYADCEQAEDAGGLIYVWPRKGAPIVVPTRTLTDTNEAARLVARISGQIRESRGVRAAD
jgi:hypothetical protein